MFTHVRVGSNDPAKSKRFYDAALGALGYKSMEYGTTVFYADPGGQGGFGFGKPGDGQAATHANGGTIGFRAKSAAEIDAFHAGGIANGGTCEGPPGVRANAPGQAYGAYLRDPDGNKICAFAAPPSSAA